MDNSTSARKSGGASTNRAIAYFDSHADYYDKNQYRTTRRTFVNGRHDQLVSMLGALYIAHDYRGAAFRRLLIGARDM